MKNIAKELINMAKNQDLDVVDVAYIFGDYSLRSLESGSNQIDIMDDFVRYHL